MFNSCCTRGGTKHIGVEESSEALATFILDEEDIQPRKISTDAASNLSDTSTRSGTNPVEISSLPDPGEVDVGDHVCPVVGKEAADDFLTGHKLDKILAASGEELGRTYSLSADALGATRTGQAGAFACAISAPLAEDCPLVFVSSAFEDLTGYTSAFATGRSCRFLQPNSKIMNDAFNGSDRAAMRKFCVEIQPAGTTIINLLLNERITGERFWNLLRMQYLEVDGELYIFGVQTTLEAYMPRVLTRVAAKPDANKKIVDGMQEFLLQLTKLRADLDAMKGAPIFELKGYFTAIMNYIPTMSKVAPLMPPAGAAPPPPAKRSSVAPLAGSRVTLKETVRYSQMTLPKGATGDIAAIDSFGNAIIEWSEPALGRKSLLKRDFEKVTIA